MKQWMAFLGKEMLEMVRTGRMWILVGIFVLFGIMNPAIAKLTPWMLEMMAGSLEQAGMKVTEVTVDALTSWTQFYKNIPIGLIVTVLIFGSILTAEYQKGTLVPIVTKGLARWKILTAKGCAAVTVWSLCYWLCFGITYGYNAYFWDNRIAEHLYFSAACVYLLGIWLIILVLAVSAVASGSSTVLLTVGGVMVISYFLGMFAKLEKYLPTKLLSAGNLLSGAESKDSYTCALVGILVSGFLLCFLAVKCFNKKDIA